MNRRVLLAFARLFVVQGSMNSERLQGIGAAAAMEPLVRGLKDGSQDRTYEEALARAGQFFNTHPYLSGVAVGAAARAETTGAPPGQIVRLWTALKGPLGAIGDQLVWAGIVPTLAAGALVLVAVGHPMVGLFGFFVLFNIFHLFLRAWGLSVGLNNGLNVARALKARWLSGALRGVGPLSAFFVGVLVPVGGNWLLKNFDGNMYWGGWVIAGVTPILSIWLLPTTGAARIGLMVVFAALLGGIIW